MLQEADPMKYSNYYLDGVLYFICDGEVYTNDETGARVKVDMLPSSIQMYGECVDDPLFELIISDIKELPDNQALITGEDGSGLCFSFIERDFSKNKNKFIIGKKGFYQIGGELESVELPEDYEDGVTLEGEEAKKWFAWVDDEVEEDACASVGFDEVAVYKQCDDFEKTGRYSFYGIATRPACLSVSEEIDEPDPEKNSGFHIAMMNQFNKEKPRFVDADFPKGKYHKGEIEHGWAVKGILRFVVLHGVTNAVYEYGSNKSVSPEEKGLFDYDDDDYEEDEDGKRWLREDEEDD